MDFLRDGYDAELTPGEMIDFFCVDSDSVIDRCNLSGPQADQVVAWFDEMNTAVVRERMKDVR